MSQPRFEYKYQISLIDYYKIKHKLICFARLDKYSRQSSSNRYLVRSLYYDNYQFSAYAEKCTGENNRIKLRLRSYTADGSLLKFISVEIKTRRNDLIEKFSAHTNIENYSHFINHNRWLDRTNPVLNEFERLVKLRQLKPKVLVEYDREAYETRDKSKIRITFDHSTRFAHACHLFPENFIFKKNYPNAIILEIKARNNTVPVWLNQMAKSYSLKQIPNSKYAQAIDHTHQPKFILNR